MRCQINRQRNHFNALAPGRAQRLRWGDSGREERMHAVDRGASTTREIKAGAHLFRSGDPCDVIHLVVDGRIFLYDLLEDGRRQILSFAFPGSLLGLYPDRIALYSAEALTDAVVRIIPHQDLGPLLEEHPGIGLRLAWTAWRERNLAYDHLCSLGRRSARERIARLLLELFIRYRMRWPGHRIEEMHLPLTQEHIADASGLTGVHVNRVLRALRKEGILEFHYRHLRIMNPDKLVDVAGIEASVALSWLKVDFPNEAIPH